MVQFEIPRRETEPEKTVQGALFSQGMMFSWWPVDLEPKMTPPGMTALVLSYAPGMLVLELDP
jgi:hypothetical protein